MEPALLDTDTVSEFIKGNKIITQKVNEHLVEHGHISFSIITYYEVLNGLYYKDAKKQLKGFLELANLSKVVNLSKKSTETSARIFAELRGQGKGIGHTDTLIAGVAIANDLQLITNNTEHFKRVKNLDIDNWLK